MTPASPFHSPMGLAPLILAAALLCGGCNLLGVIAAKSPPPVVPAAYDGLAGQRVAVWVWVEPGAEIDYPALSLQLATRLQQNLEAARDKGPGRARRNLKETTFPIRPESIERHQNNNPMLGSMPITQIAPRLDVDRVIYVEITRFTTQGGAAAGLYRGVATMNISVVEAPPAPATPGTTRPAEGTIAFQDQNIQVAFPRRGPAEGSSTLRAGDAYQGLVLEIADAAARRFVAHQAEE